jgi:rhamnosyltransferase
MNQRPESISVAMATYNGERFIREQLDSIAAQTRRPDEIVVTDDGSTDRTLEIVRRFARSAPFPVRVYCNERNLGYTQNFLKAARLCTGRWIAYCDQDDVWLPEKLATVERNMDVPAVMLIVHSAELVDRSLASTGVRYPDFRRRRVCDRGQLPTWWIVEGFVMTFRSELIPCLSGRGAEEVDSPRSKPQGHDAAVCRLARVLGDVVVLPDRLALHRWHEAAITSGFLPEDVHGIRRSRKLFNRIRRVVSRHGGAMYARRSEEARNQALECRDLGHNHESGQWREKMLVAETEYLEYSEWMAQRARLCEQASFLRRLGLLLRLLRGGGYWKFSGWSPIGRRALIKDLALDAITAMVGAHRTSQAPANEAIAVRRSQDSRR